MPARKPTTSTSTMAPPRRATRRFMRPKLAAEPDARVFIDTGDADLEVEVRTGGPARRALERDRRAARHDLATVETGRVPGQVTVVGRVAVAVDDDQQVAVADAPRVQVGHAGVRGHDICAVGASNVDAGVDLVRPRARRVVHLQVEARAAEALGYAGVATRGHGPLEHAVAAAGLLRRGRVLLGEDGDLGIDRRALGLNLRVLHLQLDLQLL